MILISSVSVSPREINIEVGKWYHGTYAKIYPNNASIPNLKWYSSDTNVATVGVLNGYIYAVGKGTTTIIAMANDGSDEKDYIKVNVVDNVKVDSITLSESNLTLQEGTSYTVGASVSPSTASNKELNWTSENSDIAIVDDEGTVSAKASGTTVITATAADGTETIAQYSLTVTSNILVTSVTVNPLSKVLEKGAAFVLNATVLPTNATKKDVSWISSKPNVVMVNPSSGIITAKKPGRAVIYATALDGSGKVGSCTVHVREALFNTNNLSAMKAEFVELLGNIKYDPLGNLYYKYTTRECLDIIVGYDDVITKYSNCYGVPKTMIQTILLRELYCLNTADSVGDVSVDAYFTWKQECENWSEQSGVPYPEAPIILKEDSSTGLGQIFASVAINAYNKALDWGLVNGSKIDSSDWKSCKKVWYALRDDDIYNIRMTILNILCCIRQYCYGANYYDYTANQYKQIFTRYNANQNTINDYGEDCYEYYLIFNKYN